MAQVDTLLSYYTLLHSKTNDPVTDYIEHYVQSDLRLHNTNIITENTVTEREAEARTTIGHSHSFPPFADLTFLPEISSFFLNIFIIAFSLILNTSDFPDADSYCFLRTGKDQKVIKYLMKLQITEFRLYPIFAEKKNDPKNVST